MQNLKAGVGNDINQKNDPSQAIVTDTAILKLMNPTAVPTVVTGLLY